MEYGVSNSKVIRIYLEGSIYDESTKGIEISDLKTIFKPFGKIVRIMIYCRTEMIKAFLEFDSFESAKIAVKIIHGSYINNFGYIKVFTSDKLIIKPSNQHVEFKDYSNLVCSNSNSLK